MSSRIEVLSPELADQIAAGEVVERPASVIKELVENSIDAGATRVEVELEGAGLERIVVVDDGSGIHPDDLVLSLTRHATSKVRAAADLVELVTLGFRGEALAAISAVADVTLESRPAGAPMGMRARARPGLAPQTEPIGMQRGTRIEVRRLFGNVPARRKFMRSEATEVGHCTDTMLRLAISNPAVHLRLRHGGRELLDLPAGELSERAEAIVRRKASCALQRRSGELDGVGVQVFLAPAQAALRHGGGLFIVVRRRAVRERTISQIVSAAYRDALPGGRHPVGAVLIEPPPGTVDVNVHPQKAEVRFSDPQRVYSAVRHVLDGFRGDAVETEEVAPTKSFSAATTVALDRWQASSGGGVGGRPSATIAAAGPTYTLQTRAARNDYAAYRIDVRREVAALGETRVADAPMTASPDAPTHEAPESDDSLVLLTCLPGPVALVRHEDVLLAVDLPRLRSHLIHRRLLQDLGAASEGRVVAQGLVAPVVVRRDPADVALCAASGPILAELGLVVEAFGDDAVVVRAVPAQLRSCVDEPDIDDLVDRVIPWLRMRGMERDVGNGPRLDALEAMAQTRGADPAPRLARRWLRELVAEGRPLTEVPGIVQWTPEQLVRPR